jgi:hypothetical protein
MGHKWLLRCLILFFLLFVIAPSFHHHDHLVSDPDCLLCMVSLHRSQLILQSGSQLPIPISKILPLLPQKQDIFSPVDTNIIFNRSPPL